MWSAYADTLRALCMCVCVNCGLQWRNYSNHFTCEYVSDLIFTFFFRLSPLPRHQRTDECRRCAASGSIFARRKLQNINVCEHCVYACSMFMLCAFQTPTKPNFNEGEKKHRIEMIARSFQYDNRGIGLDTQLLLPPMVESDRGLLVPKAATIIK